MSAVSSDSLSVALGMYLSAILSVNLLAGMYVDLSAVWSMTLVTFNMLEGFLEVLLLIMMCILFV